MSNIKANAAGYKQTLLGCIPEGWQLIKIGNIAKVKHGRDQKKVVDIYGIYPILGTGGIIGKTNSYLYNKPSVLIGRKGTIDKPRYMDTPFWTVDTLFYTELSTEVVPKWLYYKFQTINWYLYNEASGVPSLSSTTISNISIALPTLIEQDKIVSIIDSWDSAISQTRLLIEYLKQRSKRLIQELFKGNDNLTTIRLSDAFFRIVRKNDENNTNVVTISAQRGFIKQSDYFSKNIASEILDKYFLVEQGEFCYNKSYSNGYDWGAIKRLNQVDKAVVTSLYICFGIKDEQKYSGDFFEHFFDACKLDVGLSKIAHEGGRAHGLLNVTPTDFFNLKIKVPPIEQQKSISQILSKAKLEVALYEQKLILLQTQKKALMHKLLTGEIRVKI